MPTEREFKGNSLIAFPTDYTVVDIETNIYSAGICEIIEISALKYRGEKLSDSFSVLIKPPHRISRYITDLTGITDETVKDAPDISEVLDGFYRFIGQDILIGHNVHFDVNILYDNLMRYKELALTNSFVDTLRLARKTLPKLPDHKQTTVAAYFGISTNGAHRALRDCEICNACYLNLKKILNARDK